MVGAGCRLFQRLVASGFVDAANAARYVASDVCGSPKPTHLNDKTFMTYLTCIVVAAKVHGARVGRFSVAVSVRRALRAMGASSVDASRAWRMVLDYEYAVLDALDWRVIELDHA